MSLYPYAGVHAVQSAAFAIEWAEEASDEDIAQVSKVHEKLRLSLPNIAPIQAFTVQMAGNQSVGVQRTVGHVLSRSNQSGVVTRVLEVHKNRIVGQVNDYTRWAAVWGEVKNWLQATDQVIGTKRISHVGLQYNDVFHWRDSLEKFELSSLFNKNSKYLPKNIFELNGLWHSHHGFLLQQETPLRHTLIENVNVNAIEELGQRSFVISTVHKAELDDVWGWLNLEPTIDKMMNSLHARNKTALGDVLSDYAATLINLFEGKQS
jgi:uncharacterized protein (TIGR04255 family)